MSKKPIIESGKRKKAIARAVLKQGKSEISINGISLDIYEPKMARLRIQEPLILAGAKANNLNISVKIMGGGVTGQADAARLAIAKALAQHDTTLKPVFLEYDRQLLVADVRRRESRKPNTNGKARAKRQKSYR
ncbi:MAG: 30S ribosomal protein S9 [Candidatus Woesearchaeota archaeon]|jgi:small subunit ribosomal protein S9